MKEIGELLRSTREKKGLSLKQIFNETKIQEKKLKAIEEGDFSPFESEIYLKGALRKYAQAVDIDPLEIISSYEESKKQMDIMEKGDGKNKKGAFNQQYADKKQKSYPLKEKKPLSLVALSWIIIICIIIGGSIWYTYSQPMGPDDEDPFYSIFPSSEEPVEDPFNDENEENEVEEDFPPTEDINGLNEEEIELNMESSDSESATYILTGAEEKEITINFMDRCWLRAEQDGELIEETILEEGDSFNLGDSSETEIRLGHPPAVEITVNGEQIEDLDEISRPFNIIITKES